MSERLVQLRAIIDAHTCEFCQQRDGSVIAADQLAAHQRECAHVVAGSRDRACRCVGAPLLAPGDVTEPGLYQAGIGTAVVDAKVIRTRAGELKAFAGKETITRALTEFWWFAPSA